MRFGIEPRGDHLYASLQGRETGGEMREFLVAVHAACAEHRCPRILMSIRASRPAFKPEEYGITTYVRGLVTGKCRKPGVYVLWDGEELVYCGRGVVRSSLFQHLERTTATHYSWEICGNPAAREAELLNEYQRTFGRLPRNNAKAS